jgi:hypothetical protein
MEKDRSSYKERVKPVVHTPITLWRSPEVIMGAQNVPYRSTYLFSKVQESLANIWDMENGQESMNHAADLAIDHPKYIEGIADTIAGFYPIAVDMNTPSARSGIENALRHDLYMRVDYELNKDKPN